LSNQATVSDVRGLPKLEAFGNAYYARPNQRFVPVQDEWRATWDVGVQLSWSPNDLGASGSDTRTLEAERMKVLAQKAALTDRIQEEILRAYTSLREAELGAATAQRNLEAAEEAYRVQRVFYENGRATSFELLDSETRLLQARVDIVNLRVARHMAQVALAHAVGRDVP
jgi:outer membrane protein TolC